MQIQGFEVKLDDAALAWRETKYAGIHWLPLYEAQLSESARGPASDALGSLRGADTRESARGAEADALGSLRGADTRESARGPRDSTVLIRMAPGCGYPAHRHLDVEEVLVLRGGYRDEEGEHRAGSYLRYAQDSVHSPVALGDARRPEGPDNQACVLFAVARGGVLNVG